MMASNVPIAGDDFRVGFRMQKAWGVHMATAFFFGEAGAGLYFVSQFFDFVTGMTVGLLMVLFGKAGGHLLHLGQPLRGWRALTKVRSSWVSRGLLAIVVFAVAGALHLLDVRSPFLPGAVSELVSAVALLACFVIMVYQGFAMSHSSAITLWNTGLMPIASLIYALLNGVLLTLVLGFNTPFLAADGEATRLLQAAVIALMLLGLVTVLSMLHGARYGSEAGRAAVGLLLRGRFARWFIPLVIGLGFVVSALMMALAPRQFAWMLAVSGAQLAGYYAFRVLMFKAGAYDPVTGSAPRFRR